MRWSTESLVRIVEDGRKAAEIGLRVAACPYIDDMNNERLDAWIEGYRSKDRVQTQKKRIVTNGS